MNKLFFDTETTGVPRNYKAPSTDLENWPRVVQFAWILTDSKLNTIIERDLIVKPDGWTVPVEASNVHGITTEMAEEKGIPIDDVIATFVQDLEDVEELIAHNINFDEKVVEAEMFRLDGDSEGLRNIKKTCTMTPKTIVDYCKLPNPRSRFGSYKWPKLIEIYKIFFDETFDGAHDALNDIRATKRVYCEAVERGLLV